MGKSLFLRRSPLFLKIFKRFYDETPILEAFTPCRKPFRGIYEETPILKAFPPFSLNSLRGYMGSRLFLRRFPLFLKIFKVFYGEMSILEAFSPFP